MADIKITEYDQVNGHDEFGSLIQEHVYPKKTIKYIYGFDQIIAEKWYNKNKQLVLTKTYRYEEDEKKNETATEKPLVMIYFKYKTKKNFDFKFIVYQGSLSKRVKQTYVRVK